MLLLVLFAATAFGAENAVVSRAARLIDGRGGTVLASAT